MNIVYINLDSSTDRREYMESQFKDLGITATRFPAISYPFSYHLIGDLDKSLTTGEQGCLLSHLNAVKLYSDDITLILEDDTDLSLMKKWDFTLNDLIANLPPDWEVVQLFRYPMFLPIELKKRINNTVEGGSSCGAYLVHPNFAKKLVERHFLGDKVRGNSFSGEYFVAEYVMYNSEDCYTTSILSVRQMKSTILPDAPTRDVSLIAKKIKDYYENRTIRLNTVLP